MPWRKAPVTVSHTTTIVAGVVAIIFILAAMTVGVVVAGGLDAESTPLITALFGIVAAVIPAFLALLKAETNNAEIKRTQDHVQEVHEQVNGKQEELDNRVTELEKDT